MPILFEWERRKALANKEKHGITFEEDSTVFGDLFSFTIDDPGHSIIENRFIIIGISFDHKLIVVSHTDRDDRIRIINARSATKLERKHYEEG